MISPTLLLVAPLFAVLILSAVTNTNLQTTFPTLSGTTDLPAAQTILAGEVFDGEMLLWDRSPSTCAEQAEGGDADAVFLLEDGAVLSNVLIGPNNGEGIHCLGSCTLNNVWWLDVCEDAATFKQAGGISFVNGGGAANASDKVLQHNGGGTVAVKNFFVRTQRQTQHSISPHAERLTVNA
jgi:pectate lyase